MHVKEIVDGVSCLPARVLLAFRIVAALYTISLLIAYIIYNGPFKFQYYTVWSYVLLSVYFVVRHAMLSRL